MTTMGAVMAVEEQQNEETMVSRREAAGILSVSQSTVKRLQRAGRLTAHRRTPKGAARYRRSDVLACMVADAGGG